MFLTVNEVADLLKVTPKTVYMWMKRENNPIPHYKNGGTTRLVKEEVIEWFKTGEV